MKIIQDVMFLHCKKYNCKKITHVTTTEKGGDRGGGGVNVI
jgi:hypothetical protein